MATPLPIIPLPIFTIEDPDLPGGKARFKPFTIGLENILLQAKGIDDKQIDMKTAIDAVHQVIDACCVDEGFNSASLPTWVVELIFTRLRQNSVNEIVSLAYRCQTEQEVADGEKPAKCNHRLSYDLDLRSLSIDREGYNNKFVVHDDSEASIAVQFKHIKMDVGAKNYPSDSHMLADHVELISHGDEIYKPTDYTPEQLLDFVKSIPTKKKAVIEKEYIRSRPSIRHNMMLKCPKCGAEHNMTLEGLSDFFV